MQQQHRGTGVVAQSGNIEKIAIRQFDPLFAHLRIGSPTPDDRPQSLQVWTR
jgi:hypothetical protein